jgi:hypothetical protein
MPALTGVGWGGAAVAQRDALNNRSVVSRVVLVAQGFSEGQALPAQVSCCVDMPLDSEPHAGSEIVEVCWLSGDTARGAGWPATCHSVSAAQGLAAIQILSMLRINYDLNWH